MIDYLLLNTYIYVYTVQAAVNLFLLIGLAAALIDPRHLHAAAVAFS